MIRDHYKHTDIRRAELDPATFDHAEDWQRESASFDWGRIVGHTLFLSSTALVVGCVAWLVTGGR